MEKLKADLAAPDPDPNAAPGTPKPLLDHKVAYNTVESALDKIHGHAEVKFEKNDFKKMYTGRLDAAHERYAETYFISRPNGPRALL